MAQDREIQQAWSDFISFFHKHQRVLADLSPNQSAPPTQPGNVVLPGTNIPVGGSPVAPAGIDFIDDNGAVRFTGLNPEDATVYPDGHYAPRRYVSTAFQQYLDPASHAWNCIGINCGMDAAPGVLQGGVAIDVEQFTGAWQAKRPRTVLPNTFIIPAQFNTYETALAHVNALIASNTNPDGSGFPHP